MTAQAQEIIAEIKFGNRTSRIGTYLGKLYVFIGTDVTDITWFLEDSEELLWFFRFYKKEDQATSNRYTYIGGRVLTKVDWVLKSLLGLGTEPNNECYRAAVSSSEEAQQWVRGLHKAKRSINSWFDSNCPVNQEELDKAIEWSKLKGATDEEIYNFGLGSRILLARQRSLETKDGATTRN